MTKKYSIIRVKDPALRKNPYIKTNDAYLQRLSTIFRAEGRDYPERLKKKILETPQDRSQWGFTANYVAVEWIGNTIYVGDILDEGDLETRSKISKEKLFKLIDEYYELLKSNPEHIVLCRDDDFNLWFETELPDFDKVGIDEKDRHKLYNPPDLD